MEATAMRAEWLGLAKDAAHDASPRGTNAHRAWDALTAGLTKAEFEKLLSYDGPVESGGVSPEDAREQYAAEVR